MEATREFLVPSGSKWGTEPPADDDCPTVLRSAEEAAEELQEGESSVNNVVHSFRLGATQFDKKSYLTYLKGYMKSIKAHLAETNPERVPIFEKAAATFAKK